MTLAYGDHDWSNHDERDANHRALPAVRTTAIRDCGHFSSLEKPADVSGLIREFLAPTGRNEHKADA